MSVRIQRLRCSDDITLSTLRNRGAVSTFQWFLNLMYESHSGNVKRVRYTCTVNVHISGVSVGSTVDFKERKSFIFCTNVLM